MRRLLVRNLSRSERWCFSSSATDKDLDSDELFLRITRRLWCRGLSRFIEEWYKPKRALLARVEGRGWISLVEKSGQYG
jgi:hypothetical protein